MVEQAIAAVAFSRLRARGMSHRWSAAVHTVADFSKISG
jgi:hypothetical protein